MWKQKIGEKGGGKMEKMCPICEGTGKIRFGGQFGIEPGLTAPCEHCPKGAEEKVKMEMKK